MRPDNVTFSSSSRRMGNPAGKLILMMSLSEITSKYFRKVLLLFPWADIMEVLAFITLGAIFHSSWEEVSPEHPGSFRSQQLIYGYITCFVPPVVDFMVLGMQVLSGRRVHFLHSLNCYSPWFKAIFSLWEPIKSSQWFSSRHQELSTGTHSWPSSFRISQTVWMDQIRIDVNTRPNSILRALNCFP